MARRFGCSHLLVIGFLSPGIGLLAVWRWGSSQDRHGGGFVFLAGVVYLVVIALLAVLQAATGRFFRQCDDPPEV